MGREGTKGARGYHFKMDDSRVHKLWPAAGTLVMRDLGTPTSQAVSKAVFPGSFPCGIPGSSLSSSLGSFSSPSSFKPLWTD